VSVSNPDAIAHLTVPAQPEQLAICRLALAGVAAGLPVSDQALDDLKLVLSEMCSNAIEHGYAGAEGTIEVEFRAGDGDELELRVVDHGRGMPADPPHGMGMTVLEKLCSRWSVEHLPGGGGTAVTFARRLPA
jgi:anti-sigma regulatory factor (Ser/Thr protein kinase)